MALASFFSLITNTDAQRPIAFLTEALLVFNATSAIEQTVLVHS